MREILFRGQTRRKGEKVRMDGSPVESNWVYGGIFQGLNRSVIYGYDPIEKHVVYSDTVGQFTGLTDKNGKRVIVGDIFKTKCNIGVIRFREDQATFGFELWWRGFPDDFATFYELGKPDFEIIGNIHDNPELLEVDNA